MADFVVLTTKQGVYKRQPSILMSDAFLSEESRNVHQEDGKYQTFPRRVPSLYDAQGAKVACPESIYAVTAVNTGTGVFTIGGEHASEIGTTTRVNGSTGNDRLYTVTNAANNGGNTEITVSETIASATADGNVFVEATPVLRYHLHTEASTGNEYLLLATAYHILLWNEANKTLTEKFTCGTPTSVEAWSMVSHRGKVYAANNVDLVQYWDADGTPGSDFANVNGASGIDLSGGSYCTKAKFVGSFEGYLFVAFFTADGTIYPQNTIWDSGQGSDDFINGDAGQLALKSHDSPINGIGRIGHELFFFFKQGAAKKCYMTNTSTVFAWFDYAIEIGCPAPDTIINAKHGDIYWLADDLTFRSLITGQEVMQQIQPILRKINRKYIHLACAAFMADTNTILVAVPYLDATSNDLLIEYRLNDSQVYLHDIPVATFGGWYGQAMPTYATIGQQFSTYEEWGQAWATYNTEVAREGKKLLLMADSLGNTYELREGATDTEESRTASLVFDTTMNSLQEYKRINDGIELTINRATSGTVSLYYKADGESGYTLIGSQSFADTANHEYVRLHFDCDIRAKHYRFKIASPDYFEFVMMTFTNFEYDGET